MSGAQSRATVGVSQPRASRYSTKARANTSAMAGTSVDVAASMVGTVGDGHRSVADIGAPGRPHPAPAAPNQP